MNGGIYLKKKYVPKENGKLIYISMDNKKEIIIMFLRFLKDKGLYGRFKVYFYASILNKRRTIFEFLSDGHPYYYISSSFYWDKTNEGQNFWRGVCKDWRYKIETFSHSSYDSYSYG